MRAFVITEYQGVLATAVRDYDLAARLEGDVTIRVDFSSVNFKDVMVATAPSRVRRVDELVGGVDAAGIIEEDGDGFVAGESVVVHGGLVGVARDGGFAQVLHAPARYVTRLAPTLSTRDAMVIGTAGFTSMASVLALEHHGLVKGGRVVVSGATGGVGSQAVAFLAQRGYRPVASTGSPEAAAWLRQLGADEVIGRDELSDRPERVFGSELWDGAVDCVGGAALASILRSLRYGAAVAASGLVASAELATTVYPFITRANALLGIDSVECTTALRARVWSALAEAAATIDFDALTDRIIGLGDLERALEDLRAGATRGRILVDVRR